MIKIKETIKKYWWVIPALVVIPIIYILGRYFKSRSDGKKMFEEWLKA